MMSLVCLAKQQLSSALQTTLSHLEVRNCQTPKSVFLVRRVGAHRSKGRKLSPPCILRVPTFLLFPPGRYHRRRRGVSSSPPDWSVTPTIADNKTTNTILTVGTVDLPVTWKYRHSLVAKILSIAPVKLTSWSLFIWGPSYQSDRLTDGADA